MKILSSAVAATAIIAAIYTAHAAGNIPEPCTAGGNEPPKWFHCPTPYVEMQNPGNDNTFERAWYCRETDHALGLIRGGTGCGGSGGREMFPGWTLPVQALTVNPDSMISEIDAYVINPCFRAGIKNNEVFSQMNEDAALELLRTINSEDVETMQSALLPLTKGKSVAARMELYTRVRAHCIATMTGQSGQATAVSVRVEPDAILGPRIKELENRQAVLDDLVKRIRAKGWKCDSISAASTFVFSRGFNVSCNRFAYAYEIEDRGGHWVVTLD